MDRFPTLKFIVNHGHAASYAIACLAAIMLAILGWTSLGWAGAIVAIVVAVILYFVVKAFVELVVLITEMLLPQ